MSISSDLRQQNNYAGGARTISLIIPSLCVFISHGPEPFRFTASCAPRWESTAPAVHGSDAEKALAAILAAAKSREEVLRRVVVFAVKRGANGSEQPIDTLTRIEMGGVFEKWTTYRAKSADISTDLLSSPQTAFEAMASMQSPHVIVRWDGSRSQSMEPSRGHEHDPRLYTGVMPRGSDPAFRSGALHCGLLYSELWISEVLGTLGSASIESFNDGAPVLIIATGPKGAGIYVRVVTDQQHAIRELSYHKGSRVSFRYTVTQTTTIEGVSLPTQGVLYYNYPPAPTEFNVIIEYRSNPGGLASTERTLLRMPSELPSDRYTARVFDAAVASYYWIGSSTLKDQIVAERGLTGDQGSMAQDTLDENSSGRWLEWPGLILAGAGVAALVLVVMRKVRTR